MLRSKWMMAGALAVGSLAVVSSFSGAQERSRKGAPFIRIYSRAGASVASNYVEPAIDVGENVYVFAVAMDLDGRIQVLHPDFPGISVRIAAHKELQLPNFFAGFNNPNGSYNGYGYAGYSQGSFEAYQTRGVIIALASRQPFNLDRVESGGDWNVAQIRQLIDHRDPSMAAENLAHFLGARGEPIGRDFLRFAGGRPGNYAYGDTYAACDSYYGSGYGLARTRISILSNVLFLRQRGVPAAIIGYDMCGLPIVSYGPSVVTRYPSGRYPRDTTVFPKTRFPREAGRPRNPGDERTRTAAYGAFPASRRSDPAQIEDVTIRAPAKSGRRDPRELLEELGARSGSFPSTRMPATAGSPVREPATISTQGLHEFRPEPVVTAPSSSGYFPETRTRSGSSGESYSPPPRVIHESPAPRAPSPSPTVSSPPPSPPPSSSPPARTEGSKPPPGRN